MLPPYSLEQTIEQIVKEEWGRILSCIVKNVGDIQFAEDCLQDAVEAALKNWPEKGIPKSPAAWLIAVSHRKAIDRIRRSKNFKSKEADLSYLSQLEQMDFGDETDQDIPDERLRLIFTCCHPALEEKTRIALTLRTIGGLKTEEIAKAFLDTPSTMAQRIVRAKKKIKLAGISYIVPDGEMLQERLKGVLAVIYLIFNEGYSASNSHQLTRVDLIEEAIRLARILMSLMPKEPEVLGLYALMILHDARRFARIDKQGEMVALEFQNRRLWDRAKIEDGNRVVKQALAMQQVGPYQLQACISAVHLNAVSWDVTDWPQITALYALLYQIQPTHVVRINHIMAVSYADSVTVALKLLEELQLEQNMSSNVSFLLLKADLFERNDQLGEALNLLERAIDLTDNEIEKRFIKRKLQGKSSYASR